MDTPVSNKPTLQRLSDQSVHVLEETTIIGRHEDCNLVLKSERGASRKHARITVEINAAVLMDLGSLNGTMVNGREISRAIQLTDGDIVVFDEQEYRYAGPIAAASTSGDNVTVIANKEEVGKPESIKPAIRVVEPYDANDIPIVNKPIANQSNIAVKKSTAATPPSQNSPGAAPQEQPDEAGPFDDTEAWPVEQSSVEQKNAQQEQHQYGQTAIPATSRPGGDAPTPKRFQDRAARFSNEAKPKPTWLSWFAILPLVILFMLVAFYFAYKAGFSAGSL